MPDWLKRLLEEHGSLKEKLDTLTAFLQDSSRSRFLPEWEIVELWQQAKVMGEYEYILRVRIERYKKEYNF